MSELLVQNVSKRFGTITALSNVSARFLSGQIHAVLGENGAGKSTLMSVISGFMNPDEGEVLLDGKPIPLGKAYECKHLGIEMIHQHFTLVPEFTVAENLALARLDRLGKTADAQSLAKPALNAGIALGWELDPNARTGRLPVGVQQRIEILKAISGNASVLIFDEPTAVLSPDEVEELFRVLRRLKNEGKIVVLIAHKLSEVLGIADQVTVLRLGKVVATADRSDVDADKLAYWMVGEMPQRAPVRDIGKLKDGVTASRLSVLGDRKEVAVNDVSFVVSQGEIFGVGGVDGNGQVELAECLAQVRKPISGSLVWQGLPFDSETPRLGYVPQDRQSDGLALRMSIQDNMLVSGLRRSELFRGPFFNIKAVGEWARGLIARFSIKAGSPKDLAGSLSGGNQQKVVVSRILDNHPSLLIVVNPTRGLDIKATQYVHDTILAARDAGAAVVLFSADLDELYALSDRTMFLSRGKLLEDLGAASLVGGTQ
jgi:simple sugar transport system ATP-binding protein